MNQPNWLQKIYWTRFAKPTEERALFQQLIHRPIASVLEVGIADGSRMRRIAKLVRLPPDVDSLRYIGTDEFESAQDGRRHLSLKQAHKIAGQMGFKASLIPGDVSSTIPRVAHKLGPSDLIIVDGGLDPNDPLNGWLGTWLNRLAHDASVILACSEPGSKLVAVEPQRLELPVRHAA